jgi:hypothetical protein
MKPIEFDVPVLGGVLVGGVLGGVVAPVQATPLSAKLVGDGLLPFQEPLNPKVAEALVARPPFHEAFRALTCDPACVTVAFHACDTCWPAPNDQVSVQPERESPRFVKVTDAVKPPGQLELTE